MDLESIINNRQAFVGRIYKAPVASFHASKQSKLDIRSMFMKRETRRPDDPVDALKKLIS
jgi:hypothetical protein